MPTTPTQAPARDDLLAQWTPQNIKDYGLGLAEYEALRKTIAAEATPAEFRAHLMVCQRLGLSPVGGQAHLVKRQDKCTTQIGIDGYRSLAEDTRLYQGPMENMPQWQYEEGGEWDPQLRPSKVPVAARFGVYRKGWKQPVIAIAAYAQYVQRSGSGAVTARWSLAPHPQLAKCAEALALRQAFPRKLGGIYTIEEAGAVEATAITETTPLGDEVGKTRLTPEQEDEIKALNAKLPTAGKLEGYTGPTRWTLAKVKAEHKQRGTFEAVKEELERQVLEASKAGAVAAQPKAEAAPETSQKPLEAQREGPQSVQAQVDGKPVQGTLVDA